MITQSGRIVIVGAGLAAVSAAERLRERGHEGEIVVVGDEPHRPYNRTPLSKGFLTGDHDLSLRTYTPLRATWRTGTTATGLNTATREVLLPGGERLRYDGLVIATGVDARHLPGAPMHSRRVRTLRTLDDARALDTALDGARSVAVVGGGFIGCEIASTARERALDVTVIDLAPTLLAGSLGTAVGAAIGERHRAAGVRLHLGVAVTGWDESARGVSVHLADGEIVTADIAVVGVGTAPRTDWLTDTGWNLTGGVLCGPSTHVLDEYGHPVGTVVAAGDVARWPNLRFDTVPRRVEHWLNAIEMGRAAADALLAGPTDAHPFTPTPRFWSHQHRARIQSAGMPALGTDITMLEGHLDASRFVVGYTRPAPGDGAPVLVGAVAVDCPRTLIRWHSMIGTAVATADSLTPT